MISLFWFPKKGTIKVPFQQTKLKKWKEKVVLARVTDVFLSNRPIQKVVQKCPTS